MLDRSDKICCLCCLSVLLIHLLPLIPFLLMDLEIKKGICLVSFVSHSTPWVLFHLASHFLTARQTSASVGTHFQGLRPYSITLPCIRLVPTLTVVSSTLCTDIELIRCLSSTSQSDSIVSLRADANLDHALYTALDTLPCSCLIALGFSTKVIGRFLVW